MALPTVTRQYSYPETQVASYTDLVFREVPLNGPKANEVLVKTHAVSLQYRDLMIARGEYPGRLRFPQNLIPCSDMAGEVISVGEDVKKWKTGDRVTANFMLDQLHDELTAETMNSALGGAVQGVLTEYRKFPAHSLVAIPNHLSYEEASTLPSVFAFLSRRRIHFAVASGATVIATSSSDDKLKLATKLGAKHVINYETTMDWDTEVLKLTNGLGVDRVIELGGNSTLKRSISSVKIGGSIDLIGVVGGLTDVSSVDVVAPSIFKGLKIRGIYVGSVAQFKNMNRLLSANIETTRPIIDKVFALEEAKEAFKYLESQAHVGKVVIKF
ncbi:chaperonin 10-like protein [Mycena galericulata]|nr:chaperonin 10-like protein [Mycena galericulata]